MPAFARYSSPVGGKRVKILKRETGWTATSQYFSNDCALLGNGGVIHLTMPPALPQPWRPCRRFNRRNRQTPSPGGADDLALAERGEVASMALHAALEGGHGRRGGQQRAYL